MTVAITVLAVMLWTVVAILVVYTLRHNAFTLNRIFGRNRQPYVDVTVADWPRVIVFVPCHNEEKVIAGSLDAILTADYPHDRLTVVPIDDRSTDATGEILEEFAARWPGVVQPYRRRQGRAGKAAALSEVSTAYGGDGHLVFDADYVPGPKLLKQLVAPFFDPEVGAVMGRVVPHNVGAGFITRILDLERSGGYQVDQQARMNLRLVPQYGGTVGGVRRSALAAVGGWRTDTLAEDTDITYRLLLRGYEIVYQNRSECYEEVPESWPVRIRQIRRWATGHNQALARYGWRLLARPKHLRFTQVLDGALLLGVFAVAPLLLLGWILALTLYYLGYMPSTGALAILLISGFSTLGNFAAFFEVAAAARLDGSRNRVRLLPLLFVGFLVSHLSITRASLRQLFRIGRGPMVWHKTERYREAEGNGNGNGNGHGYANGDGRGNGHGNGSARP